MLFFWHPAISKKKGGGGGLRLTNGCWVLLSIGTYWVRQKVICGFPHTIMMTRFFHFRSSHFTFGSDCTVSFEWPCHHWENCHRWVCTNHLVQCNRLIFSVILHIFLMFTGWFNMQHMESRRECALVNVATPCKILSALHSLLRHGIHEYCIAIET